MVVLICASGLFFSVVRSDGSVPRGLGSEQLCESVNQLPTLNALVFGLLRANILLTNRIGCVCV